MTSLGGIGYGGYNPYSLTQSLFNEIDTSGSGSINKSELEKAVTAAGGTAATADALYTQLDPNNTGSVNAQQFSQNLPALPFSGQMGAQMIGFQAQGWPAASGTGGSSQLAPNLFSQIDTNGVGSITKSQLEQAVTAAGGTSAAADALYAQLDPNNTGSVSEQQFAQYLQPPSPTGTTAQDAILALLDPTSQSASGTAAVGGTAAQAALQTLLSQLGASSDAGTAGSGADASGNAAQDALLALLGGNFGSSLGTLGDPTQDPLLSLGQDGGTGSIFNSSGSTAQDALLALLQAIPSSSSTGTAGSSSTATASGTDLASAIALYQSQINQQMLSTVFGTGTAGI